VPRATVLVAAAAVATVVIVGGGVVALGGSDDEPAPDKAERAFRTTALADFDTSGLAVRRASFCDDVDDRQAEAALDVAPEDLPDPQAWQNGDRLDLGNGAQDVVHEFGCRYAAQDGAVAMAWVYAPPVDAQQAGTLVARASKGPGCQVGAGPAFGSPTLALTCPVKDGTARASYRGLFGDAWLVCEVDRPPGATGDVADRAGRWCVGVLQAAAAT
jgi:hypothetical protein